ncbi:MAG: putative membrane protein required for colicin V production [Planctomycetota bacterium]|jgi:uncharacterized membrane protein required for colicin V production
MTLELPLLLHYLPVEESGSGLAWIDMVGLGFAGLFILLGVWRGLWWQVIRLLGVIAAVGLARALTPRFYPTIQETFPEVGEGLTRGIVWFALFLTGLVIASLLGMLGRKALETMQLGMVDRVGGALVGALTGLLLHGAFLVGMVTLTTEEFCVDTLEGTGSEVFLGLVVTKAPLFLDTEAGEKLLAPLKKAGNVLDIPSIPGAEDAANEETDEG